MTWRGMAWQDLDYCKEENARGPNDAKQRLEHAHMYCAKPTFPWRRKGRRRRCFSPKGPGATIELAVLFILSILPSTHP
jgi:hypothetical protein